MTETSLRLSLGPWRRVKVMTPSVVGVQLMRKGDPAITASLPSGLMMGFSAAKTTAEKAPMAQRVAVKNCMLIIRWGMLLLFVRAGY